MSATLDFIKNVWYAGMLSSDLKVNSLKHQTILNQPIVFYRDSKKVVHALRDICPHRGIPLSYGRVVDDQVECPYHGWKFNCSGECTEIPSLTADQPMDTKKIRVKNYQTYEVAGIIWVFIPDENHAANENSAKPFFEELVLKTPPKLESVVIFPCHLDHAVIGLMDPAHGPFVHKSWLWRSEKTILEKKKAFGPVEYGFQMRRHRPSANSKAYKIFGGDRSTQITFCLPSVRVEHILSGKKNFYSFTALTPISEKETRVFQLAFWDQALLSVFKPFLKIFSDHFLGQDMDAVTKQQDGLKWDPSLMLIKDADTQAKWYFALKKEWAESQKENRPFQHPVPETELKWRS
jgi:phenylpropionate dioxygenase-like ring-hydroxylating dioxygenase large terminal subunit